MMRRLATSMAQSSEVNDPGAPAPLAPAVVGNAGSVWRLGAVANGPRRARVLASQIGAALRQQWRFGSDESTSTTEIEVLALADGLLRLAELGACRVDVAVADRTLSGYLWRGWVVHSLALHRALSGLVDAAGGLAVTFRPTRYSNGPPSRSTVAQTPTATKDGGDQP